MPIIQTGPLHGPVTDVEAQRAHQMQAAAGGGTGPGDVAGVHGDLRFHKNDIQHGFLHLAPDKLSLVVIIQLAFYCKMIKNSISSRKKVKIKRFPQNKVCFSNKFSLSHKRRISRKCKNPCFFRKMTEGEAMERNEKQARKLKAKYYKDPIETPLGNAVLRGISMGSLCLFLGKRMLHYFLLGWWTKI